MSEVQAVRKKRGSASVRQPSWRYVALAVWLLFTVSLTVWWIYFGISQVNLIGEISHRQTADVVRHQKMLLWEGAFLVLFLFGGAAAMGYLMWRERRERQRIEEFFAAFTHELKTPLASLILQAEVLSEAEGAEASTLNVQRFVADAHKLNLQLENSLALAERDGILIAEEIPLRQLIENVALEVPQLATEIEGDGTVRGDERALRSIVANLLQNSLRHGKATTVAVAVVPRAGEVHLSLVDNGSGFKGDRTQLGALFARHYQGSGSGTGLYLVRELTRRMGGEARFPESATGFAVELSLPRVQV